MSGGRQPLEWCNDYHCAGDCGLLGHGYQHAGHGVTEKSKGGRPPAPPGLRRVNVPLRLPEWLVQWMSEQPETPAELIEAALLKAHKLRPPRAP